MYMKHVPKKGLALTFFLFIVVASVTSSFSSDPLAQIADPVLEEGVGGETIFALEEGIAYRLPQSELTKPHQKLTPEEQEAFLTAYLERRQEIAASSNIDTSDFIEDFHPDGAGFVSLVSDANVLGSDPGDLLITSNVKNTMADNFGNSTLAEPAAANEGSKIFYAGNLAHNEFSTDGGATWTSVNVPGGPMEAPIACCDWDVVYDQARGVTFISVLYRNNTLTNGVVRIFVRRDIRLPNNCAYDFVNGPDHLNTVPDFPHINISNDFLYLTTNNNGTGPNNRRAQVRRINIDDMANCAPFARHGTFSYIWDDGVGQRVFVPVDGARETMYWFMHEDFDTLRIFRVNESDPNGSSVLRNVNPSVFGVNEDCSGGIGGNDWWDNLAANIIGFNHRGAVGHGRIYFYWPVASDNEHTQGHIHGAIFEEKTSGTAHEVGDLIVNQAISNPDFCFGLPNLSANERGDIGIVLAYGGNEGPGGDAANFAVGIDDDFTGSLGPFTLVGIASGTHNRADERYGDYFTIHPHEPCDLFFNATGYVLDGGVNVTDVNARYVEFGRRRDLPCYTRWDDEDPTLFESFLPVTILEFAK